jgi:diguanylate cyclase (GGDEF)-like protein
MFSWAKEIPRQQKELGVLSTKGRMKLNLLYSLCDRLVDLHRIQLEDAQARIAQSISQGEKTIKWGGIAVFSGVAFIGTFLALSILTPLSHLQSGIRRVMEGDFTVEIAPGGDDEIGRITQAFNAMTRQLREKHEQLLKETITDALTGLRNFRYFEEALKTETERARRHDRPLSLVIIDIDHFKLYNDANGHEMGNVVLKTASQTIHETLRPGDMMARYGGEEFVVFLPDTDRVQAEIVAERAREVVATCNFPGQQSQPTGHLTISLGGASFPADAQVANDLIGKADKALYQAKNAGRNRVQWA